MSAQNVMEGIVYTETTVFSPPQQYAAEAPYQIAIIDAVGGSPHRITVRILSENAEDRVGIGDHVIFVENRSGVPCFRRVSAPL